MSDIQNMLHAYLTKRDGSISRGGKAMLRIAARTGYSVEALRSYAYGRRSPEPSPRLAKLRQAIRRG